MGNVECTNNVCLKCSNRRLSDGSYFCIYHLESPTVGCLSFSEIKYRGKDVRSDIVLEKLKEVISTIHNDVRIENQELSLGELAIMAAEEIADEANRLVVKMKSHHGEI